MTERKNPRVTVVCCLNNRERYERELGKTLAEQTESYLLIEIDNRENRFSSCSGAYNSVLDGITTPFAVFAHQDILLSSPDTLKRFVNRLEELQAGDILGVAGVDLQSKKIVSTILHGKNRTGVTGSVDQLEGLLECETVDECFFGCRTETIRKLQFNEDLCDNWHLYAVELCLRARKAGGKVYICDTEMVHTSTGTISHGYCKGLFRLCRHYKKDYAVVYTTCSTCRTNLVPRCLYCLKREAARIIYR